MRIVLAFLVLFLPGLAWWLWLGDHEQDGGEALARIFAVSFATVAALALGLFAIRVSMTPILAAILLGVFAGAVIVGLIRNYKTAKLNLAGRSGYSGSFELALVAGAGTAFPAGSIPNTAGHRSMLAQPLPATLEPYLPGPCVSLRLPCRNGCFSQLSGLENEQAMLLLGRS